MGKLAVILCGGFGTRLRPFTFSCPKSLTPFANMPIIEHQVKALVAAGVDHVILAAGHFEDAMTKGMKPLEDKYKIKITFSIEETPLGTAGPLALCRDLLTAQADPFFMLNSDVACEFPLADMLSFHTSHGGEATIMITPVEDPSKYGLVVAEAGTGKISAFLEKPAKGSSYPSDKINAGIYLLNPTILDLIPLDPTPMSIERQIFPHLVGNQSAFAFLLQGFWCDIGQPKDFLAGTSMQLRSLRNCSHRHKELADNNPCIKGNVLIHDTAEVHDSAVLGPDVVIGPGVKIGVGCRISESTIMAGTSVENGAIVKKSIVGWESTIKPWAYVDESFLGKDVTIAGEIVVSKTVVCPHKSVSASTSDDKII